MYVYLEQPLKNYTKWYTEENYINQGGSLKSIYVTHEKAREEKQNKKHETENKLKENPFSLIKWLTIDYLKLCLFVFHFQVRVIVALKNMLP